MRSLRSDRLAAALPLAALLAAGCGIGVTEHLDAGQRDAMDGPYDAPTCLPNQTFGTPKPVPGLDPDTSVESVRFTPDELDGYISMFYGKRFEIRRVHRARPMDPLGTPTVVPELMNTVAADDTYPTVTARNYSIYFSSARLGHAGLFVATRTAIVSPFSGLVELTELESDGEDAPYVLPDGSALYFQSHRNGTDLDIYRAENDGTGFHSVAPLAMINTNADESMPVVSPDELTIYFFRHGVPNRDDGVWMATRSAATDMFGTPAFVDGLNMPYAAAKPIWISPDGCRLYLQEQDPQMSFFVYYAERMP